jgi:hypothetical protein
MAKPAAPDRLIKLVGDVARGRAFEH